MSDEDESADPGMTAEEREIFTLLSDREARASIDYEGTRQDGRTTVSQSPQHPAPANPVKQKKTAEELEAMIQQDLSQLEGWPERGVKVTVYGFNPWNSMLTIGVEAGPVPRADLQGLCDIITERLKRLYVIDDGT
jgi:hypothetical protein